MPVRHEFAPRQGAIPSPFAAIPALAREENLPPRFSYSAPLLPLQRKLAIGAVNDPLEAEADAMAERVMQGSARTAAAPGRATSSALHRKCSCEGSGKPCAACEEEKNKLQRRASGSVTPVEAPPIVHDVLSSPGQPLDAATRSFMEPRFEYDFSRVRIHADTQAAESAKAVNALAYTVGSNVVFAAGHYAPQSGSGCRLLAHELAHVVQDRSNPQPRVEAPGISRTGDALESEADRAASEVMDGRVDPASYQRPVAADFTQSGPMIHRVPAPPSYKKVTGTIDLTKLQFTPVPDFKLGSLASPLVLTPTLADPSLVHLSWELYDPADSLIDGFSTLPGFPTSKTKSFSLRPDLFQAGKAPTGRYTVRLTGRNAAHEPLVYFERYFFVLAADLKTGTANTSGFGDFTFTEYGKTDGDFAKGQDYVVDIKMKFMPKVDAVDCKEIGFLQVLESSDTQGLSNHRFAGARKEARKTPLNYSVDRAETGPSPFYGTFKDPATKKIVPGPNYKPGTGGHAPGAAELEDHPTWSQATVDRFETCATCRAGTNAGQIYGCVTWGFSADTTGKVTLMPRSYNTAASDTLKPAVANWNVWRAAQPTPADFEAAPSLK